MSYNLSFLQNQTNIVNVITSVNNNLHGWFVGMILLLLWIILFSGFKNYDTIVAFIGSSFIISILSSLCWFAGILDWYYAVIPMYLTLLAIIYKAFQ